MMSNRMSFKEAKKYIKEYCKYNCEVYSCVVEGVISAKDARNLTDKDTIINLAEDLQYQVRCEVASIFPNHLIV